MQTIGLFAGYDSAVRRGDPAARSFSLIYLRGGKVIALDCINAMRDFVQGRALVEHGALVDPTRLADTEMPLKPYLPGRQETRQ